MYCWRWLGDRPAGGAQIFNLQIAITCSISLKFDTDFDVTADALQMFKFNGSKVMVTACSNVSAVKYYKSSLTSLYRVWPIMGQARI